MSFEVDPARHIINTDIPTLGNYYTGEKPDVHMYPLSVRLAQDGQLDPSRRFAPFDLPGMARVLAVARLPQGFGNYANGLIMFYTASTSGYTCLASGKVRNIWHPSADGIPGYIDSTPDSVSIIATNPVTGDTFPSTEDTLYQMPLGQYEVRAAVHPYAQEVSGYSSGWVILDTTFGRGGWRYDQQYNPEFGGYAADTVATFDDVYEVYGLGNTTFNGFYNYDHRSYRGTRWPMTVNIAAQRLGKYVVASLPHNPSGIAEGVQSDDSLPNMWLIDGETLTAKAMQVMDGVADYGLESETFTDYALFLDDGVDPYLYILWGAGGNYLTETRVRLSEITLPAQKSTFPLVSGTNCRAAGDLALIQTRPFEGPGIKKIPAYSGEVSMVYVNPWRGGDYGAPEVWAFVRTGFKGDPSTGTNTFARLRDVAPLSPPTATATIDIYAFRWQAGQFTRGNNRSNPISPLVGVEDDSAFTAGTTQYPAANPAGMAREKPVFDAAHKLATITLPNWEYQGAAPQPIYGVYRSPRQRGHLVLTIQAFGNVLDSRTGRINPAFFGPSGGQQGYSAAGSTTQFWTAHSYDDGKTWTEPAITAQPPLAHTPDSGDVSHKIDAHLIVPWDGEQFASSDRQTTRTTDVLLDGQLVVGVTEYIGVTNTDGGHVPFWTSPPAYGTRHSLYFPEGFSDIAGSLDASPDGVVFKRTST